MRISDWSSDVCSSDLPDLPAMRAIGVPQIAAHLRGETTRDEALEQAQAATRQYAKRQYTWFRHQPPADRSEEHTSELQSLMRISYAVFCLKKKTQVINNTPPQHTTTKAIT